jgi:hypothetical protein
MADEQYQETSPDAPERTPEDKPKSEAATNREIHLQAQQEHRKAQQEARIARKEALPEGVVVPNQTRAPSPVTHDPFLEEDEGAIGEP